MNVANKETLIASMESSQTASMESLARMVTIVSAEALLPSNYLNAFTSKVPEFFGRAKEVITQAFNSIAYDDFDRVDSGALQRATRNIPFLNMVDLEVAVPVGMKVTYKKYLETILHAQDSTDKLIVGVLKPLQQHLAILLNDPVKMSNVSSGTGVKFTFVDLDKLRASFAACIDQKANNGYSTYGAVFERPSDLREVDRLTQSAVARYQAIGTAKVQKIIEDINQMVEILMQRVEEDPDAYKFSGPVLKQLVSMVYSAAQQVEFYGLIGFRIKTVTASLNQTYKTVVEKVG